MQARRTAHRKAVREYRSPSRREGVLLDRSSWLGWTFDLRFRLCFALRCCSDSNGEKQKVVDSRSR